MGDKHGESTAAAAAAAVVIMVLLLRYIIRLIVISHAFNVVCDAHTI